jgi:hypothetical protein
MCKLLVENGCDISIQDSAHKTAIHYAKTGSKAEVVDYLTSQLYKNRDKRRANTEAKNHCTKPVEEKSAETSSNTTNGKTPAVQKIQKKKDPPAPPTPPKIQYKLMKVSSSGGTPVEVPAEELREVYRTYPDLEKLLGNPDAIEQAQIDDQKQKDTWQKAASKVLGICWKAKGGYVFHEPVDPEKFGINDYFDVVKNPMDFGTVKEKLKKHDYKNV